MKNLNLSIFVLGAVLLFTGCVEVTFPEPMPFNRRDRSCFPNQVEGVWYEQEGQTKSEDSIKIYSELIDFGENPLALGENAVLRKFNGFFVFSARENDESRWTVYLAKHNDATLSLYEFDGGDEDKIALWEEILLGNAVVKIQKETEAEKLKEVRLNPSNNSDFRALINKGGLSHMGDYVR